MLSKTKTLKICESKTLSPQAKVIYFAIVHNGSNPYHVSQKEIGKWIGRKDIKTIKAFIDEAIDFGLITVVGKKENKNSYVANDVTDELIKKLL